MPIVPETGQTRRGNPFGTLTYIRDGYSVVS